MGDAARRWNEAVEDPSALMQENANLRMLTENGAPVRAQSEMASENEQLKMDAAFAASMCGMADKDRAVAMAESNLLRAKLEKWESVFGEDSPAKARLRLNIRKSRIAHLQDMTITLREEIDRLKGELAASEKELQVRTESQKVAFAEVERLRAAMAAQNDEITQVLAKSLGYPWYKDDPANFPGATEADGVCVGEHVAETIAHEAARRIAMLQAELAKAPRWVPVGEWENADYDRFVVTLSGFTHEEPGQPVGWFCEAYIDEEGVWRTESGIELSRQVTHVLANLNPPDVTPNEDSGWLREMASKEDNGCISVGGLVGRFKADETTHAVDLAGQPQMDAWETRKKELAAWAKTVHDTLYPVAPDASDAMSVAKPLVESPADCVVPCKRCNGRNLIPVSNEPCSTDMMECPECYSPTPQCVDMLNQPVEAGDMMYFISERLLNVATIKGGNYINAVRCPRPGEVTPQFDGWQTMCLAMQSDGAMFQSRDEVSKQWLGGEWNFDGDWATEYRRSESCKWSEPKCLDMLGQDVVSGDVLWDKKCKILEKRPVLDAGDYEQCVRIPRPGETIPLSDDWRDMCLAMQESGVEFEWLCNGEWGLPRNNWPFAFEASSTRYRRSPSCTWKGPK